MTFTEIFFLAGILIQIGIYLQTGRSNSKAIDKLTSSHEALSSEVVAQGKEVYKIKGFLGINGDNGFQRGKGHHQ